MNPHYDYQEPNIIIEPDMWKNEETAKYSSLYNMDNLDIPKLIDIGYEDARKHKEELDEALKWIKQKDKDKTNIKTKQ